MVIARQPFLIWFDDYATLAVSNVCSTYVCTYLRMYVHREDIFVCMYICTYVSKYSDGTVLVTNM